MVQRPFLKEKMDKNNFKALHFVVFMLTLQAYLVIFDILFTKIKKIMEEVLTLICQPWIMVALACVFVSAFITLFWGRDFNSPHVLYLFPNNEYEKWPHWVCGGLLSASFVIWVVFIIMNHTTVATDILLLLSAVCASAVLIYVAQIVIILLMVIFVSIIMGVWCLVNRLVDR